MQYGGKFWVIPTRVRGVLARAQRMAYYNLGDSFARSGENGMIVNRTTLEPCSPTHVQ